MASVIDQDSQHRLGGRLLFFRGGVCGHHHADRAVGHLDDGADRVEAKLQQFLRDLPIQLALFSEGQSLRESDARITGRPVRPRRAEGGVNISNG